MKILLAGATGYLGSYIAKALLARQIPFQAIARNVQKLKTIGLSEAQILSAELTQKDSIQDCCNEIDVVISTVGITRQKDGLSYMDVDYQANQNLLEEAQKSGVKKFIYVSVLHGESLQHLQICQAKERFVASLKSSGLEYCIIRPSGFFSDMKEFYQMAKKGSVYLFGDGHLKANPIHGADLAKVCVDAIWQELHSIEVGGPEILTQEEIAKVAFAAVNKNPKIIFLPDWIRKGALALAKVFMSKNSFGPVEFFLNVMTLEMLAPTYGTHTLKAFYEQLTHLDKKDET